MTEERTRRFVREQLSLIPDGDVLNDPAMTQHLMRIQTAAGVAPVERFLELIRGLYGERYEKAWSRLSPQEQAKRAETAERLSRERFLDGLDEMEAELKAHLPPGLYEALFSTTERDEAAQYAAERAKDRERRRRRRQAPMN